MIKGFAFYRKKDRARFKRDIMMKERKYIANIYNYSLSRTTEPISTKNPWVKDSRPFKRSITFFPKRRLQRNSDTTSTKFKIFFLQSHQCNSNQTWPKVSLGKGIYNLSKELLHAFQKGDNNKLGTIH